MIINESLKKSPFYANLVDGLRANGLDLSIVSSETSSDRAASSNGSGKGILGGDKKIQGNAEDNPVLVGSIRQNVLTTITQKREEAAAKREADLTGEDENSQQSPSGPSNITKDGVPIYDKPSNGLYRIQKSSVVMYINYVNFKKNGEARICDLNENIKIKLFYVDNEINGETLIYGDHQNIEMKIQFEGGKKNGPFSTYYENGIVMNTGYFIDNVQQGESTFFDMYGDVCQKSFYRNGKKHGACTTYFPKSSGGGVVQKAEYENGLLVGKQETFYTTGELLQTTPYTQGKAQEYSRSFNQKGVLVLDPAVKN